MPKFILLVRFHATCPCPCPCCISISMMHFKVHAAFQCPCCISMSMLHVGVHAACQCPCCMYMSMLPVHVSCMPMSMLHVDVYAACRHPCFMSMFMLHLDIHAVYPCLCPCLPPWWTWTRARKRTRRKTQIRTRPRTWSRTRHSCGHGHRHGHEHGHKNGQGHKNEQGHINGPGHRHGHKYGQGHRHTWHGLWRCKCPIIFRSTTKCASFFKELHQFRNVTISYKLWPGRWLPQIADSEKLISSVERLKLRRTFVQRNRWDSVKSASQDEKKANESSWSDNVIPLIFTLLKIILWFLGARCPFKIQYTKLEGLRFIWTECLSLVSTPLRIRWKYLKKTWLKVS